MSALARPWPGFLAFMMASVAMAQVNGRTDDRTRARLPVLRTIDILGGGNAGHYVFLELGIARRWDRIVGHHPSTQVAFLGAEGLLGPERIIAPKVGVWAGGGAAGLCVGINALWYTNGTASAFCFRPEIGIGFDRFKMAYGYNFLTTDMSRVNRHLASIALLFPIKLEGAEKLEIY